MSPPTVYEPRQWLPLKAPITNGPEARDESALRAVLAQFDLMANARYRPCADGRTWCNVYVRDACTALKAPLPAVLDPATCAGLGLDDGPRETSANLLCLWLASEFGRLAGWRAFDSLMAGASAARGLPVVAAWANPNPHRSGHVAMLLPPHAGQLRIAQAGSVCLFDAPLERGFGRLQPAFFSHP